MVEKELQCGTRLPRKVLLLPSIRRFPTILIVATASLNLAKPRCQVGPSTRSEGGQRGPNKHDPSLFEKKASPMGDPESTLPEINR